MVGALLLCTLVLPMASCGGDEPKAGASTGGLNSGGTGDKKDVEGLYLTSINNMNIDYDDKGRVESFYSNYESCYIDYNKGVITVGDEYDDIEDINFKFNGKGYFSEISQSWSYKEDGKTFKGSGKGTFSYDKDGHLTKMTSKSSESGKYEGESYNYSLEVTITFTWKNGNLVKVNYNDKEKEDGETDLDIENYTLTYDGQSNPFRQVTYGVFDEVLDGGMWSIFACAGLLGVGTDEFPSSMIREDAADSYERYSMNYSTNNDGTLKSENFNGDRYNYGYNYLNVRSAGDFTNLNLKNKILFRTHRKK